jgi:5-(carboxyamino)imidazole ribonucleotide mutase
MGSESDLPVMKEAADVLRLLEISFEMRVLSAHRTPDYMAQYARTAHERGVDVIIAGAGGAAHLPGMIASYSPLPVIGVPVPTRHLQGLDSLLSIVQMPNGVPVATVAIGKARNAGLLAAQIIGVRDHRVQERILEYKRDLIGKVERMDASVRGTAADDSTTSPR